MQLRPNDNALACGTGLAEPRPINDQGIAEISAAGTHTWVRGRLLWLNNTAIGGNKFNFSGQSNHVAFKGAMLTKCRMEIQGSNNSVDIGKGTRLRQASIFIKGKDNRLIIHEDCVITAKIELIGDNCLLEIGQGTNIRSTFLATFENDSRIVIGKGCLFSEGIDIRTGDSHSIFDSEGARVNHAKPIIIGDHVWLGRNVTVLKGVQIGEGSIVGTCALVTKNLGSKVLAVGAPAKVVRENIGWSGRLVNHSDDLKVLS